MSKLVALLIITASVSFLGAREARADDGIDCGARKKTCFADGTDASCICVDAAEYVPNPPELAPNADTGEAPPDGGSQG